MTAHRRALELVAQAAPLAWRDPADGALYGAVEAAMAELVGFRLLTVLRLDGTLLRRVHSSDLPAYPAGGAKDIANDTWLRRMLDDGVPVVSADRAAVQRHFFDFETIFALGCGAALNLPVGGPKGTLGSLNVLHEEGWFTPGHVLLTAPFATLLAIAWTHRPG